MDPNGHSVIPPQHPHQVRQAYVPPDETQQAHPRENAFYRPYTPVQQPVRQQPLTPPPYPYSYPPRPAAVQPSQGLATASLATGICGLVIALLGSWLIYPAFAAAVLGILAIVFSAVAKKNGNTAGQATAGLVLGILSLIFSLLFVCLFSFVFSLFHIFFDQLIDEGVAVARFLPHGFRAL